MKYIGIVARVDKTKEDSQILGIGEYYRKALAIYKDVYPILLLPPKDIIYGETSSYREMQEDKLLNSKADSLLDLCDGFIIPGGNRWFSFDEYVVEHALKKDKPILGICLGMQILGIVDNKINQGIFDKTIKAHGKIEHQQYSNEYIHSVSILENTKLRDILKVSTCKVNSRHKYCIGDVIDFKISAYSEDGIIEAIEHPNKKFALGVQWHPESLEDNEIMRRIFDAFVEAITNEDVI